MPAILDDCPNLSRVIAGVSEETREAIIAELDAIHDAGRASAYERAIKSIGPSRRSAAVRAELAARAAHCRRER